VIKGFVTFHTKRGSTQTYVSSFWIVEHLRRGEAEYTASRHIFYNAKRVSTWVCNFQWFIWTRCNCLQPLTAIDVWRFFTVQVLWMARI